MASTSAFECDGALSDLILQAARAAVPADHQIVSLPDVGPLNQSLLPLLVGLIDAAAVTAAAIHDNAWDSGRPLDRQLSIDLAKQCNGIAGWLVNARYAQQSAASTDTHGWSLPSMTGKELV
jgi:hypothetical protein